MNKEALSPDRTSNTLPKTMVEQAANSTFDAAYSRLLEESGEAKMSPQEIERRFDDIYHSRCMSGKGKARQNGDALKSFNQIYTSGIKPAQGRHRGVSGKSVQRIIIQEHDGSDHLEPLADEHGFHSQTEGSMSNLRPNSISSSNNGPCAGNTDIIPATVTPSKANKAGRPLRQFLTDPAFEFSDEEEEGY